jgi:hypothetical protein
MFHLTPSVSISDIAPFKTSKVSQGRRNIADKTITSRAFVQAPDIEFSLIYQSSEN